MKNLIKKHLIMPKSLPNTLEKILSDGADSLHCISDFDDTLTLGGPMIRVLRNNPKYLWQKYAERAHELFDIYHPYEISPSLSTNERKEKMQEWYKAHLNLLIESWLTMNHLKEVVQEGNIQFRTFVPEALRILHEKNIPFIIMSASGIGDTISMFLEKNGCNYPNIHYVCNRFIWDAQGKAVGVHAPIVHSANKDETAIEDFPEIYEIIKKRLNVILFGDSLWDIGMADGFPYEALLTVGFYNPKQVPSRETFEDQYALVFEGETDDFWWVKKLFQQIVHK